MSQPIKTTVRRASGVTIAPCTCKNDFQDKTYGKGLRVKNNRPAPNSPRCTVCGK